jgi:ubiquitin carboxyl-terminal hydrolase 14
MPKVNVKWSGNRYEVDADTTSEPILFKAQLFELTGIAPERMKVVFKGKALKDDTWEGFNIIDGALLMLLGSVEEAPKKPKEGDDAMDTSDVKLHGEEKQLILPAGLGNLGNTCYMNATLQVMRTIPELNTALSTYSAPLDNNIPVSKKMSFSLKLLFDQLNKSQNNAINPGMFVVMLHQCFPQLATKTPRGENEQQDASECWSELVRCINNELDVDVNGKKVNFRKFIEGVRQVHFKNTEAEDEEAHSIETFNELSCYLSQEVKYLQLGINKTKENITKHSEKLGKDAVFEKTTLISRLPAYLCIQMVRFFYKEKEQINAKILKDVKFPKILDVFEMCTPELKERLAPQRAAFKEYEDKAVEDLRQSKLKEGKEKDKKPEDIKYAPFSFDDDPGSNNSGFYELQGIVTHKGRSSNSGHYVGWVRLEDNKWVKCDDDDVEPVAEEDVFRLSGGGDWHSAYLLLYGSRRLPLPPQ